MADTNLSVAERVHDKEGDLMTIQRLQGSLRNKGIIVPDVVKDIERIIGEINHLRRLPETRTLYMDFLRRGQNG